MVGWTRRNAEDRERRRQWLASLTSEELALERRQRAEENRLFKYFPVIMIPTGLAIWLVPQSPVYGLVVFMAFCTSMFAFTMWTISKYKKIK
jgi:hypothetical protein